VTKLFVSYSRKDSKAARRLVEAFKASGLDVWVDWEDIPLAAEWLNQIFTGIEQADAFIFLISPDSVASEICKVEISKAVENNKRIIPIVLRDLADAKLAPESIGKLNWTYIRETDDFQEGLAKVKTAIELDLDWLEEHRRLQVRALEWHRKKDPSLLLRGRDLRNAQHMLETYTAKDPIPTDLQRKYIEVSGRTQRTQMVMLGLTVVTLIIMIALTWYAVDQSQAAVKARDDADDQKRIAQVAATEAIKQKGIADSNAATAQASEQKANQLKAEAEDNKVKAEAQRSAARAQIYQGRPGELFTSTLLAIDSLQRNPSDPSDEAEEILRGNISLLPFPLKQFSQTGRINALDFSPDGSSFVTASADGTACVWKTAEEMSNVFCTPPGEPSVNAAVFSPDGTYIVTGDQAGVVRVLDAQTGEELHVYERVKPKVLNIQIIDTKNADPQSEYTSLKVPVRSISIRSIPKGQQLAVAYEDNEIPVFDPMTGGINSPLQAGGEPNLVRFNRNLLLAGSENGHLSIWNLSNTGENYPDFGLRDDILAMAFHPKQSIVAIAGNDNTVKVISLLGKELLFSIPTQNTVRALAFSPDGTWLVTVSDDHRIRVWDSETGEERLSMTQDDSVTDVVVSPDGRWIATTGQDRTARVWDATTGTEIFQIPLNASGAALAFSPRDGNALVVTDESGAITTWDMSKIMAPKVTRQFDGTVDHMQYAPSGERLAVSSGKRMWLFTPNQESALKETSLGSPAATFRSNIQDLAFSPDSKYVGILTAGNEVAIYNVGSRSLKEVPVGSLIQAITFSPDSQAFITRNAEGNIQAWGVSDVKLIESPAQDFPQGSSLATSPQFLAVGAKDKINIVGKDGKGGIAPIDSSGTSALLVFNQDGSLLASADAAGQINIWKYQDGAFNLLTSFVKERAKSLAFNATGTQLAVGIPKNVILMDVASGREIARIPENGVVNGISFSPDGTYLATISTRALQFWETAKINAIPGDGIISAACSRLYENFSQAQWTTLFGGDQAYKKICSDLPEPQ
jgi:WD40 repeat protein